jgi:sortase A
MNHTNRGIVRRLVRRWIERALFVTGGVLALWCAVVAGRASYYSRLGVPPATRIAQLPGESPDAAARAVPAPAPGAWIARLEAASIALSATVLEGSDDGTLSRAAGHIEDTAFPGRRGNIGIAGHRDTVFRRLGRLHVGDALTLTTSDHVFHYRVSGTQIVAPEDVYVLDPTNRPVITLVTCYPFGFIGHAPRRFIVRADLVSDEARVARSGPLQAYPAFTWVRTTGILGAPDDKLRSVPVPSAPATDSRLGYRAVPAS